MKDIVDEILNNLPKGKVKDISFEGANIVLYTENKDFFLDDKGMIKEVVNKIPEEIDDMRKSLLGKKMKLLRGLGADYNAKDTSKEELVDEIIEKVPLDRIKQFLEVN